MDRKVPQKEETVSPSQIWWSIHTEQGNAGVKESLEIYGCGKLSEHMFPLTLEDVLDILFSMPGPSAFHLTKRMWSKCCDEIKKQKHRGMYFVLSHLPWILTLRSTNFHFLSTPMKLEWQETGLLTVLQVMMSTSNQENWKFKITMASVQAFTWHGRHWLHGLQWRIAWIITIRI